MKEYIKTIGIRKVPMFPNGYEKNLMLIKASFKENGEIEESVFRVYAKNKRQAILALKNNEGEYWGTDF
jgi:antitoxin component YwqK of YwqJK toxin-antitoxin module